MATKNIISKPEGGNVQHENKQTVVIDGYGAIATDTARRIQPLHKVTCITRQKERRSTTKLHEHKKVINFCYKENGATKTFRGTWPTCAVDTSSESLARLTRIYAESNVIILATFPVVYTKGSARVQALAAAIEGRHKENKETVIVTVMNAVGFAEKLTQAILSQLNSQATDLSAYKVVIQTCVVNQIVKRTADGFVTGEQVPLIVPESLPANTIFKPKTTLAVADSRSYLRWKLYLSNGAHNFAATLAFLRGFPYLDQALEQDKKIHDLTQYYIRLMQEQLTCHANNVSNTIRQLAETITDEALKRVLEQQALAIYSPQIAKEIKQLADSIIPHFKEEERDPVFRIIRHLKRKTGADDRVAALLHALLLDNKSADEGTYLFALVLNILPLFLYDFVDEQSPYMEQFYLTDEPVDEKYRRGLQNHWAKHAGFERFVRPKLEVTLKAQKKLKFEDMGPKTNEKVVGAVVDTLHGLFCSIKIDKNSMSTGNDRAEDKQTGVEKPHDAPVQVKCAMQPLADNKSAKQHNCYQQLRAWCRTSVYKAQIQAVLQQINVHYPKKAENLTQNKAGNDEDKPTGNKRTSVLPNKVVGDLLTLWSIMRACIDTSATRKRHRLVTMLQRIKASARSSVSAYDRSTLRTIMSIGQDKTIDELTKQYPQYHEKLDAQRAEKKGGAGKYDRRTHPLYEVLQNRDASFNPIPLRNYVKRIIEEQNSPVKPTQKQNAKPTLRR